MVMPSGVCQSRLAGCLPFSSVAASCCHRAMSVDDLAARFLGLALVAIAISGAATCRLAAAELICLCFVPRPIAATPSVYKPQDGEENAVHQAHDPEHHPEETDRQAAFEPLEGLIEIYGHCTGPARNVCRNRIAAVSSSTAPAWCAAASGIGTTSSRVETPSANCSAAVASSACKANRAGRGRAVCDPTSHSSSTATAV